MSSAPELQPVAEAPAKKKKGTKKTGGKKR